MKTKFVEQVLKLMIRKETKKNRRKLCVVVQLVLTAFILINLDNKKFYDL
jgi:hypothetical protein